MASSESTSSLVMQTMSPLNAYFFYSWDVHFGYAVLGAACMLSNALSLVKFFKEAKTHSYIGQRPLLLAAILADFFNGLAFTTAGASGIANRNQTTFCLENCTAEKSEALWPSCLKTFYTPALIFLQSFTALVVVCTSFDRLTAVATPVFYSQCVKPRHCYTLLGLISIFCSAALIAAYSTVADDLNSDRWSTSSLANQWPPSACIAPFANDLFSRYFYGAICSVITAAIVIDLLGLINYRKMARQRAAYESHPRDYGVASRNYLPRLAFGSSSTPPPANVVHPNQNRQQRQHFAENANATGCSIPMAMCATMFVDGIFFLVPCLFFWFSCGIMSEEDARDQFGASRHVSPYVAWGLLFYSLLNSLVFYVGRKNLRKSFSLALISIRGWCRCLCMSLDPDAVCETTPVEVIGDPASATSTTMSSVAKHPRMRNQRPSIVPLAYGTTEM